MAPPGFPSAERCPCGVAFPKVFPLLLIQRRDAFPIKGITAAAEKNIVGRGVEDVRGRMRKTTGFKRILRGGVDSFNGPRPGRREEPW